MWAALILAIVPYSPVVEARAETVEVSLVYSDTDGTLILSQLIWWNTDGRVIAWRLLQRDTQLPSQGMVVYFDHALRKIQSVVEHHTWRLYDPEIEDRRVLPPEQRVGIGE